MKFYLVFCSLVTISLLSGCSGVVEKDAMEEQTKLEASLSLAPVSFDQLDGWEQDSQQDSLSALSRSCAVLNKKPASRPMGQDSRMGVVGDWQEICQKMPDINGSTAQEARDFFERYFMPYHMADHAEDEGLFTGYYEPNLRGSLTRTDRFSIPLRARPSDLVMVNLGEFRDELKGQRIAGRVAGGQLKPYDDRQAIEEGQLPDTVDVPLVWVDSAVDAFFLQIQGSGMVQLDNGVVMRVGYDGQNGHVYTAIGKELIARGVLTKETVSMQSIKEWLLKHPTKGRDVMRLNRSYVFFRELKEDGPVGAQGVVLTPERSLAVDPIFVPYGAPVFLVADHPEKIERPIASLVIAQDTGGAIKGAVRGDLFWGHGERAAHLAGLMKSKGRAWLLLPKKAAYKM